ncbi:hypothetical protein [Anaplasma marginale]|uniref:hypothetical protein n=1 Tax=Anaplasma marginale TaxID=770 RepID=UPI0002F611B6|nr:hypothetical protein [Anaplasma marginale]
MGRSFLSVVCRPLVFVAILAFVQAVCVPALGDSGEDEDIAKLPKAFIAGELKEVIKMPDRSVF